MLDLFNDDWGIKEPIDYKKKEVLFILMNALDITHNEDLRYRQSPFDYLGSYKEARLPHRLRVFGLREKGKESIFPFTGNVVSVDEVIEALELYAEGRR